MSGDAKRARPVVASLAVLAATASGLLACGGSGNTNQFPDETPGQYEIEVTTADFPARQVVARTYDLVLTVGNPGDEAVPELVVTVDLPGRDSVLAFADRSEQAEVAAPQRPIWVLEEGYPKLAGTAGPGGAATSNRRTFQFGPLAPGDEKELVWRVTAVQPGAVELSWLVGAGLSPEVSAVDRSGEPPAGFFEVEIEDRPRLTRVNAEGEVVEVPEDVQIRVEREERNTSP